MLEESVLQSNSNSLPWTSGEADVLETASQGEKQDGRINRKDNHPFRAARRPESVGRRPTFALSAQAPWSSWLYGFAERERIRFARASPNIASSS